MLNSERNPTSWSIIWKAIVTALSFIYDGVCLKAPYKRISHFRQLINQVSSVSITVCVGFTCDHPSVNRVLYVVLYAAISPSPTGHPCCHYVLVIVIHSSIIYAPVLKKHSGKSTVQLTISPQNRNLPKCTADTVASQTLL